MATGVDPRQDDKRSLKEKWSDHWDTRSEIWRPKPERAERFGMAFFWVFSLSLAYTVIFVIIPGKHYTSETAFLLRIISFYITFMAFFQWFRIVRNRSKATSCRIPQNRNSLVQSLPVGWRNCPSCQIDVPPRSHHCKVCRHCVLKRDHHCFFTGTCVGFDNQAAFVVFVFYTLLGSAVGLWLLTSYTTDYLPIVSHHGWNYIFLVAVFNWIFGPLSSGYFVLIVMLYSCVITFFASILFVVWEMVMICRGQTSWEATHGVQLYKVGALTGLKSVFGPFWPLQFLLPIAFSPEGNGLHWETKIILKGN